MPVFEDSAVTGFLLAAEICPRHPSGVKSLFSLMSSRSSLAKQVLALGETGGKNIVASLESRRILAKNWGVAEVLGPCLEAVFGGVSVPVLSCCALTADNEV